MQEIEDLAYLLALSNKLAAEGGLEECDRVLAKLGQIDPEMHSAEIMSEMNEVVDRIHEHQQTLRDILWESNSIIARYKAPTN